MLKRFLSLGLTAGLALPLCAGAPLPAPPGTPRRPVTDTYHGVQVTEDYRWLEDSADPAVKAWSHAQNDRARGFLDALPSRAATQAQVDRILRTGSVRYGVSHCRGGRLFAYKVDPKLQQPMIVSLASADDLASEKVLLDPNTLDPSGLTAIDWFEVDPGGKTLAVSLSKGGSEAGDLHFYDVASGKEVQEPIAHVQGGTAGGSMAFAPDGSGLWYTRYPRGSERPAEDLAFYQQIWFHRFGTPAGQDLRELGPELPRIAECVLTLKDDGRWVLAEIKNGDGGEAAYYLRETRAASRWRRICRNQDGVVFAAFGEDSLFLLSRKGAPRGRILRLALGRPEGLSLAAAREVVKPSEGAIQAFLPTRHRLYVQDLLGGPSRVRVFSLEGRRLADLPILPVSSAGGLVSLGGDDILFQNGSYLVPPATYRFSAAHGGVARTALVSTSPVDFADAEVVRQLVPGRDGVKIPINIIKKRSTVLDGSAPLLLYAYGGFAASETPRFSAMQRVWLDRGGIYVDASIRGGAEFGEQWHEDGKLLKKPNCFEDFEACASWLVAQRYTSREHLAILGGSNGGLLMGALLTRHPEAYRAVVSEVGIYDMLRNEGTTNGLFNVTEYGSVKDPAQFKVLRSYSPLHQVRDGVAYPSILLTTGANDPRVEPWHSRKFCARLQAADPDGHPILLRTSDKAGHGIGSSLDEQIALQVDIYAFLFHELGME